ncbi:MAG: hypothetical protein R3D85_15330 [Paracoccaceae bacterium]
MRELLDDGTAMWIVDWEYSGMNDPLWDLGDLSVEAGFDVGTCAAACLFRSRAVAGRSWAAWSSTRRCAIC